MILESYPVFSDGSSDPITRENRKKRLYRLGEKEREKELPRRKGR